MDLVYTVRYAHLDRLPDLKVGDIVKTGSVIGVMGSSGQSTKPHLHLDCVCGEQSGSYTLADIDKGFPKPAPLRQLLYFADKDLFGFEIVCTTPYAELEYFTKRGKVHYGFDLVPLDRHTTREHFTIYWNRSKDGKVSRVAYDEKGYGYHINIAFNVV